MDESPCNGPTGRRSIALSSICARRSASTCWHGFSLWQTEPGIINYNNSHILQPEGVSQTMPAKTRKVKLVPAARQAFSEAREPTSPMVDEAKRRGDLAVAALKGEDVTRGGGRKKWLVLGALAGAGAIVYKKLVGSEWLSNWHASYTQSPAPEAPATPVEHSEQHAHHGGHQIEDLDGDL